MGSNDLYNNGSKDTSISEIPDETDIISSLEWAGAVTTTLVKTSLVFIGLIQIISFRKFRQNTKIFFFKSAAICWHFSSGKNGRSARNSRGSCDGGKGKTKTSNS